MSAGGSRHSLFRTESKALMQAGRVNGASAVKLQPPARSTTGRKRRITRTSVALAAAIRPSAPTVSRARSLLLWAPQ